MSSNAVFNVIVFDPDSGPRLHLRLTGPWVRSCGIGPDVNVAIVSASEWDNIDDASDLVGTVKFFYSSDPLNNQPDVTLAKIKVIDVQPDIYGAIADSTKTGSNVASIPIQTIAYKVTFADMRQRFAHPFGGRVAIGEINKTPLTVGGSQDLNGHDILNPQRLAKICLAAMGVPPAFAANTLSDQVPPFDLEWRGNHAPTELSKVLQGAGHTVGVDAAGNLRMYQIGNPKDVPPVVPDTSKVATLGFQAIERGRAAVVFSSAPNAIVETKTITGPYDDNGDDSWEFVIQDADGIWQTLDKSGWFTGDTDALNQLRAKLAKVPAEHLGHISGQLFRCIRLNRDNYGPAPLDRTTTLDDRGRPADLIITAKIASLDSTGVYRNLDKTSVRVLNLYDNGHVIHCADPLLQVDAPAFGDLSDHAKLIGDNDLQVRCSRELHEYGTDASGTARWMPKYFEIGYQSTFGGAPQEITGTALANLVDGGTAPIRRLPSLRLIRVDGKDVNMKRLTDMASAAADAFLTGSGDPAQQIIVKGFFAGELNGVVGKISYHQEGPRTIFETKTYFLPASEHLPAFQEVDKPAGSAEKYPQQAQTAAQRASTGSSGYTQQTVPINSWPSPPAPPGMVKVKISGPAAGRGKYTGGLVGGASTATADTSLIEPEGMTDPAKDDLIICNLAEDKSIILNSGPAHVLPAGYYFGKPVGGGSNGTIVEIDSDRCGATSSVNLSHTDSQVNPYMDSCEVSDRKSVTMTLQTRTVMDVGSGTLYAYYRSLTIDCGIITNIGGEMQHTIDVTELC